MSQISTKPVKDAWGWVALATLNLKSTEKWPSRGDEMLAGILLDGEHIVATDRHRLHVAAKPPEWSGEPGVYATDRLPIPGKYPNWRAVSDDPPGCERFLLNQYNLMEFVGGAAAFCRMSPLESAWVEVQPGGAAINALYLLDALRGMTADRMGSIFLSIPPKVKDAQPIRLECGDRRATIMNIRVVAKPLVAFDLSQFLHPVPAEVPA